MSMLNQQDYLQFPLHIGGEGGVNSDRIAHVREQIEQVLFTHPGERWYRPDFGAGVSALVFEINNPALWEVAKKCLVASLSETLAGEVDPKSLQVDVAEDESNAEQLVIVVRYNLAALNHSETQRFLVGPRGAHG